MNPGARDATVPVDTKPYKIDRPLYFGEKSKHWQNGGVAFLENDPRPGFFSYGRIYKITNEQFDDVVLQENGLMPGTTDQKIPRPDPGFSSVVFESIYGRIICLENFEGSPVYTFTRPTDIPPGKRYRPSNEYLGTIIAGLVETVPNISQDEIVSYFSKTEAKELGPGGIKNLLKNLERE